MSLYVKDSPISQINSSGKAKGYQVPRELGKVVARSLDLCRLTGGALDITVKPLLNAYEDAANLKRAPTREEISAALEHVGHMKISVSDDLQTITVADDGMSLDLSATAKGYAVDEAAQVLRENGIVNAFVEAGGDIRFVGPRGDGSPWTTGVQDPMLRVSDDDMAVLAVLNVASGAVCTSGNYAQGYRLGGQRVSHIVDPRSGMPCDQTPSVTITAPDAFIADALATALSVLGADGLEIIEKMEDVEAFILTVENGKLVEHKTSGFNK